MTDKANKRGQRKNTHKKITAKKLMKKPTKKVKK